ncbi:hypothetical protein CHELA1G11_20745 [Hyphomicrobiales bacterium]|nr:hypothetical protein CHELA1G11_20745 [Hyphomicrobiales bacterium]CAH1691725.1 hypothetical protein CHELA1G2_21060 [Hyphomicrobiales bacterium]
MTVVFRSRVPSRRDKITLGLGIGLPPGTRHWLNDVTSGDIGVFMPGDEHDLLYVRGISLRGLHLERRQT